MCCNGCNDKIVTVQAGPAGPQGIPGNNGTDGLHGRGVAVFSQEDEPNQDDFDALYGNVDGFGVNGIPGSNEIKPGDIWIHCADEEEPII